MLLDIFNIGVGREEVSLNHTLPIVKYKSQILPITCCSNNWESKVMFWYKAENGLQPWIIIADLSFNSLPLR